MAKNNIMSLVKARNKTSRSGYDLSKRIAFSTKPGELHPIWWRNVLPGDHWEFDLNSFMRTAPVATASQGRLRYYYDFFFVPMEQLWQFFPTAITQMNDNKQHSNGLLKSQNPNLDGTFPSFTINDFESYVKALDAGSYSTNMFGFKRSVLSKRLLSYLSGVCYSSSSSGGLIVDPTSCPPFSLLPWAAYQKIYADYFRYTQWETVNPATFNFNYMKGSGDTELADYRSVITGNDYLRNETIFDMRYCNYQKDLFHGLLPTSQFGEEAAVPLQVDTGSTVTMFNPVFGATKPLGGAAVDANLLGSSSNNNARLLAPDTTNAITSIMGTLQADADSSFSSLPILLLRQYESYQKWKEISLSAEEDYKSQLEAHWNVSVSEYLSGMVRYLGGISGNVNVNEVVNQTLTEAEANIRGKGLDSANGKITFDFKGEYGILMIIQHSLPLLDYNTSFSHLESTLIHVEDYPIAELDSIGMEQLPSYYLSMYRNIFASPVLLGYMPRYCQFKTDIDQVFGAFRTTLKNWVLPYDDSDIIDADNSDMTPDDNPNVALGSSYLRYQFFKVNPHIVDDMFASAMDDTVDTDPLWFWCYLNVRVTRNLDRNGLPY